MFSIIGKKENSKFKQTLLRLKIDIVLQPSCGGEVG